MHLIRLRGFPRPISRGSAYASCRCATRTALWCGRDLKTHSTDYKQSDSSCCVTLSRTCMNTCVSLSRLHLIYVQPLAAYYGVWVELSIPASQHDLRLTIVKSLFSISHITFLAHGITLSFVKFHCLAVCLRSRCSKTFISLSITSSTLLYYASLTIFT